jgi:hypothetical protein
MGDGMVASRVKYVFYKSRRRVELEDGVMA